jgi:hypothetical protein
MASNDHAHEPGRVCDVVVEHEDQGRSGNGENDRAGDNEAVVKHRDPANRLGEERQVAELARPEVGYEHADEAGRDERHAHEVGEHHQFIQHPSLPVPPTPAG